jgi:hypothetical protein
MSEIEKMYENAGIAPKKCSECDNNMDCGFGKGCYPPFTAEKQIAILIALVNYNLYEEDKKLMIDSFNGEIYIGFYQDITLTANATDKDFAECVAKLVNKLWQDLSEEEKQQVKGILE